MSAHTKTPWETDDFAILATGKESEEWGTLCVATVGDEQWKDDDGNFLPAAEDRANAQHIVTCVNSHDELLEALKGMIKWTNGTAMPASRTERTARAKRPSCSRA